MRRSIASALIAVGALGCASAVAMAEPINIYGIDDVNTIWEIDPVSQSFTEVNVTGLPGTQRSNSMAYDTGRDEFMFTYNNTFAGVGPSVRYWNRKNTGQASVPAVATFPQAGIGGDPANAAYYDNAFWYMAPGAQVLHRVSFDYAGSTPTNPVDTAYQLGSAGGYSNPLYPAGVNYGDIAIDVPAGVLYGASTAGLFYSVDLKQLGAPGAQVYRQIGNLGQSLQIAFSPDYSTLLAQSYDTGRWYTVDLNDGSKTDIGFQTLVPGTGKGFRDLGGSAATTAGTTCEITPPGHSDKQYAQVGTAVKHPPSVQLLGDNAQPQVGVPITFTITAGGGTLGGATSVVVLTNENGVAMAPAWVLGSTPGANSVFADDAGNVCNLTLHATATVGPPPDPSDDPTDPQKPVKPSVLPPNVHPGTNTIAVLPIKTNAGQVAKVKVTCNIASTGRPAPKGRCVTYIENQRLKLRISCGPQVRVRVVISAPATGDFKAYRRVRTYLATGECAVTG